jgi:transposase
MDMSKRQAEQRQARGQGLVAIRPKVAGIDIGSRRIHVCGPELADGTRPLRSWETTTAQLQACGRWLQQLKVESVAMESTGVYWIPVWEILESSGMEVLLVDTRPLARVPGRKTDVLDCQWIQTLHSCGLLQGCYRPTEEVVQLRNLVRQKAVLVAEQSDWLRRMHKEMDQMNVRVHQAVADVQGTTGMQILRAIVGGERDPQKLATYRDPRCHKSPEQMAALLTGHWRADHLFNLGQALQIYDALGARLAAYEREIERRLLQLAKPENREQSAPPVRNAARRKAFHRRQQESKREALYRAAGADLTTIDGIGVETAEVILSEYGVDLSSFATEKQFVAHLQLAPRQAISGGKALKKRPAPHSTRTGRALRMAATAVQRGPTALGAYYRRIARQHGPGVAVFATARKLATLIYRLLRWGQPYVDEGQAANEKRYEKTRLRSLAATAAQFGYQLVKNPQPVCP